MRNNAHETINFSEIRQLRHALSASASAEAETASLRDYLKQYISFGMTRRVIKQIRRNRTASHVQLLLYGTTALGTGALVQQLSVR